jgi:hypothetical protein
LTLSGRTLDWLDYLSKLFPLPLTFPSDTAPADRWKDSRHDREMGAPLSMHCDIVFLGQF